MNVSIEEAIKLLAIRSDKSLAGISRDIGMSPANLNNMISRNSVRGRLLATIASVCGYKLVLVPKDTEIDGIEIGGDVDG